MAPPWLGVTSAPATCGFFSGFGIGWPRSSYPSDQLVLTYSDETRFLPVVRSRTKKCPLRDAMATSLRGWPLTVPSMSTGVCVASQSCVSCGEAWKYHFIVPVSASSATSDAVYRFAPSRFL